MHRVLLLAVTLLVASALCPASTGSLQVLRRESLREYAWTAEEARWIKDHVGVIFYGEGKAPFFSQNELIDIAQSLGLRRVKTWLKGSKWGEMAEKLGNPEYRRMCGEFDTVLFDVCPDFVDKGPYDDTWDEGVHDDYAQVAYYLASNYRDTGKTFLLSLFMETNLFFGTQRSHFPDFPVDRFFRNAADGVRDGIKRAGEDKIAGELPRIYTVIEVAGIQRDFMSRYLPKTEADLYAISYYRGGELGLEDATLKDCIEYLSGLIPHDGPFGQHNIILGELGRNVFWGGNRGEDREQIEYLRRTLNTAREAGCPYAFIFWLTDQERHVDDGWGFISSKQTGAKLRRSWHAFQKAFGGKMPSRPRRIHPAIDAVRCAWNVEAGKPARMEIDIANRSSWDAAASPVRVKARVVAGDETSEMAPSLRADELITLSVQFSVPEDRRVSITLTAPGMDTITQAVSLDRPDLVIERIYTEPESPKPGEDVRLFAVVRNVGKSPMTDFSVTFHVDDFKDQWVTWGCIWGETKIGPGESLPIGGGFLWKATPGKHRIRAWANPDGSRESDHSNNTQYWAVDVPP